MQRMMAVLLSAVLVVGMVSNAAPMTVLAKEDTDSFENTGNEYQESVSGNEAETAEGDVTQDGATPEEGTEAEPAEESSPKSEAGDGTGEEPSEAGDGTGEELPEANAGTGAEPSEDESGNDAETVGGETATEFVQDGAEQVTAEGQNDEAMTAVVPGTITSDQKWGGQTLSPGTYTINSGVTVTIAGRLDIGNGEVIINGGGRLVRDTGYTGGDKDLGGKAASLLYVNGGTLTLENVTVDGASVTSYGQAIYVESGTVNLQGGAVIQNNKNMNTKTTGVYAGGGIYCKGTLNVNGGTIRNCCTLETGSEYTHAGGGIYLKGTCNMTAGSITGNTGSNGGGIYLASDGATLNLTGGSISNNTAAKNGNGIYYSTAVQAISRLSIGGDANVEDVIYLDNTKGELAPAITSALKHPIRLACSSREEGKILAEGGAGYTLTDADAGQISMADTNLHSKLNDVNNTVVLRVRHEHGVSGGSDTKKVFTELQRDAAALSSGSYYLAGDTTLDAPLAIPNGAVVDLCLNGRKLEWSGSGEVSMIVVEEGGTLNLCDCNGSHGSHTFASPATGQSVTVEGGIITRSTPVDAIGSGMRVKGGGTCNFYGGSVAGISDTGSEGISGSHGAVRVEGVFHMYGGAVTHNRSGCGGGVNVCSMEGKDAFFYFHGGSIAHNYADYADGGGICLNGRCSFVMEGGEIKNNRAKSGGGGIECYGDGDSAERVSLSGGTITGNTTGGDVGGGIKCGDVSRPLTVSGSVRITGNTNASGKESNLYLCDGKTLSVDGGFSSGAVIGVTTESAPTSGNPVSITGNNTAKHTAHFTSDIPAFSIADGTGHQVWLTYQSDADKVAEAWQVVILALTEFTATNETTQQDVQAMFDEAFKEAGITDVTVTVVYISKTEATASKEGWIGGQVNLECGNEKKFLSISRPIPILQIPGTEEVAAAKAVVEAALAKFTATNDTTEQDVQDVIDAALRNAGITDVTATVGNVTKRDATTDSEGILKGDITLACKEASDGVAIDKEIAKLPRTTMSYTLNVTIEGYEGSDPAVLGAVTLKRLYPTEEEWTPVPSMEGNRITCTVEVPNTGTYQWNLGGTPFGYQRAENGEGVSSSSNRTFYSVFFQNGSDTYATKYVSKTNFLNFPNKVTAPPAPTREGYTFAGWVTEEDGSDAFDFDSAITGVTTVYASWTKKAEPHTCSLSPVPKAEPDCTTAGKEAHYHCAGCGKNYEDAKGTRLIADLDSWGNIAALGHDYGTEWKSDEESHWHVCSRCSAKAGVSAHAEDGGTVTKEPTETETGIRTYCCSVCRKELRTETIPATGEEPGAGTVTPEVKPGANAPATSISTPAAELKDVLLTEEEKQQVKDGTDVRIVLEVQDAGGSVPGADKAAVEAALGSGAPAQGFVVGQYLNVDLYKLVGDDRTDIRETAKKLRIVLTVPDGLKNTDGNRARAFAVVRVHDGKAELLTDLDDSAGTITIETDRFSTYTIVYKDSSNGGNEGGGSGGNEGSGSGDGGNTPAKGPVRDNEPKTGDAVPLELYATLAMVFGLAYLLLYFTDPQKGMTEETKKELVSRLVAWAKQGGRLRRALALAAIFVLLVYYHGTKKMACGMGEGTRAGCDGRR